MVLRQAILHGSLTHTLMLHLTEILTRPISNMQFSQGLPLIPRQLRTGKCAEACHEFPERALACRYELLNVNYVCVRM